MLLQLAPALGHGGGDALGGGLVNLATRRGAAKQKQAEQCLAEWHSDMETKSCILVFVDFRSFSGQTWPQDPFKRVRLEIRCIMH